MEHFGSEKASSVYTHDAAYITQANHIPHDVENRAGLSATRAGIEQC